MKVYVEKNEVRILLTKDIGLVVQYSEREALKTLSLYTKKGAILSNDWPSLVLYGEQDVFLRHLGNKLEQL